MPVLTSADIPIDPAPEQQPADTSDVVIEAVASDVAVHASEAAHVAPTVDTPATASIPAPATTALAPADVLNNAGPDVT